MGHSKTNWERRALKAEEELRLIGGHLVRIVDKAPAILQVFEAYPLLLDLLDAMNEPVDVDDHTVQTSLRMNAAVAAINTKFPGGLR